MPRVFFNECNKIFNSSCGTLLADERYAFIIVLFKFWFSWKDGLRCVYQPLNFIFNKIIKTEWQMPFSWHYLSQSKCWILSSFRTILTVKECKQFDDRRETSGVPFLILMSIKVYMESSFTIMTEMMNHFIEMSISKIGPMKLEHDSGHLVPSWTYLCYLVASLSSSQKQL